MITVVVVGHSSCGGVVEAFNAAASPSDHHKTETPLERWLEPLTDYARSINVTANSLPEDQGVPLLVEDNVKLQVNNLLMSEFVLEKGANVWVHGWVYDLANGTLRDLGISRNGSKISW
jgi:carbonic anhydrase